MKPPEFLPTRIPNRDVSLFIKEAKLTGWRVYEDGSRRLAVIVDGEGYWYSRVRKVWRYTRNDDWGVWFPSRKYF